MSALPSHVPTFCRHALAALFACLTLAFAGTACRETTESLPPCPDSTEPAFVLTLEDEANQTLTGANLRYRFDGGAWQTWPERTGSETVLRGGPGTYELEIDKPGHESVTAAVNVSAVTGDACRPHAQAITLEMAHVPCPEAPAPLLLTVEPSVASIAVSANVPGSGHQTLSCSSPGPSMCGQYELPVTDLGAYELRLDGLPGLGPMRIVSDVVTYDPPAVAIRLEHRGRQQTVPLAGAESAVLSFPVRLDEDNCALADFHVLAVSAEPDLTSGDVWPPLAVAYMGSLTMTDLGAAACQNEPVPTLLPFAVDLPAGTPLADVRVLVEFGEGWQPANCGLADDGYMCQALVPNPLVNRPFAVRVLAGDEEATGMQLPFSGLCLIFE